MNAPDSPDVVLAVLMFLGVWEAVKPPRWNGDMASAYPLGFAGARRQGWDWWFIPVSFSYTWSFSFLVPRLAPNATRPHQLALGLGLAASALALWCLARREQEMRLADQGRPLMLLAGLKLLGLIVLLLLPSHGPLLALSTFAFLALMAIVETGPALTRLETQRAEARDSAEAEYRRAEALKDQALRAKLAPHFIFNTLNTLKAQIAADPEGAESTTDRLASLFRQVVQVADQPTIPLRQELAFVEAYLGIEQARLGHRLAVVLDIPEDIEERPVPPLALQVLVENAIKHGIAPFEQPGTVTIQAEAVLGGLRLSVTDTGRGEAAKPGTGTALATLRQRLAKPDDLVLERLEAGFRVGFIWRQA